MISHQILPLDMQIWIPIFSFGESKCFSPKVKKTTWMVNASCHGLKTVEESEKFSKASKNDEASSHEILSGTAVQSLMLTSYSAAIAHGLCPSCKLAWQKPGTEKTQFEVHSWWQRLATLWILRLLCWEVSIVFLWKLLQWCTQLGMCSTKRNTVIAFKIWLMWHISVPFRRGWEWKDWGWHWQTKEYQLPWGW